jgi:NADPH:quinone reductase-like Zn-dependent oxidoreductase
MKAVVLTEYGGVDKLVVTDVPEPAPGPHEVKVRVEAASINPVDYKLRRGDLRTIMPMELPTIPGRDVAGTVVEVGSEVSELKVGDRVMGLVEHGYAEMVVALATAFAKVPEPVGAVQAAALPLAGLTGVQLVENAIEAKRGEILLVTGAVGSVGRVAVFTAKQHGARVIAGVRGRQRLEAESLGADEIVALDDRRALDNLPLLDAVADTVDGDVVEALLPKIKRGGVLGTVLREPPGAEQRDISVRTMLVHPDAERLSELGEAVANGEFALPVKRRYALSEVRLAQRVAEKHGAGKVVLVT